mmetsp:Transcript_16760/g.29371  ORF Transcript_16760/g.29371 Transcript_16760/m.29371 type:complete len:359 (-) Transcript_16760:77-1153(-)
MLGCWFPCHRDDDEDPEGKAKHEHESFAGLTPLGKVSLGISIKEYALRGKKTDTKEGQKDVTRGAKKKVLCIIDVQDGYDADFLASLPDDILGGLAYIQDQHSVRASFELQSGRKIKDFKPGEKQIRYDKVWNRGLNGSFFGKVADRCIQEIKHGSYDLVVFTYDYLEKQTGEEKGVFALDDTPWTDPCKPVARISYGKYLTINAGGVGTDISQRIRKALPEVTNARGPEGLASGKKTLYFRKQVDDAFNDDRETSDRTMGEAWLDEVDVDDHGWPKPQAETLLEKLTSRGFGPDEAVLSFCGVVTNRCVASSLLHAVDHGYNVQLLEGGCCAADEEQHARGVTMILEKGGHAVEKLS